MPTAVENKYAFAKLDELEPAARLAPGATDDGRKRFDIRRTLDITAFGVSAFSAPNGVVVINEHDETLLGEAGQEELYIVVKGAATFEIDGESVEAPTGAMVNVQPTAKRKATATEDGIAAYTAGEYEEALAKQLVVVEKQPDNPVAHFNVGCFAARAGHADQAIEALGRAVEINDRIKELMATDEDLDSIREDQRFVELMK